MKKSIVLLFILSSIFASIVIAGCGSSESTTSAAPVTGADNTGKTPDKGQSAQEARTD